MKKNKMDFTGWNHIEITAWLFQDEKGQNEVIKLVEERLKKESDSNPT